MKKSYFYFKHHLLSLLRDKSSWESLTLSFQTLFCQLIKKCSALIKKCIVLCILFQLIPFVCRYQASFQSLEIINHICTFQPLKEVKYLQSSAWQIKNNSLRQALKNDSLYIFGKLYQKFGLNTIVIIHLTFNVITALNFLRSMQE